MKTHENVKYKQENLQKYPQDCLKMIYFTGITLVMASEKVTFNITN